MIAIRVKSKKALKEMIGKSIGHLIHETSLFGNEYTGNDIKLPYVGPGPYQRKFYGQITTVDGVLTRCS